MTQQQVQQQMQQKLVEHFFRYLAVSSQSNAAAKTVPSSDGQWQMAQFGASLAQYKTAE